MGLVYGGYASPEQEGDYYLGFRNISFYQGITIINWHLYWTLKACGEYNSDDVLWFREEITGVDHNMLWF